MSMTQGLHRAAQLKPEAVAPTFDEAPPPSGAGKVLKTELRRPYRDSSARAFNKR
jgi:hypothetical protein